MSEAKYMREVLKERERCAKICDAYLKNCEAGGPMSSMAEDVWGVVHARELARLIRAIPEGETK